MVMRVVGEKRQSFLAATIFVTGLFGVPRLAITDEASRPAASSQVCGTFARLVQLSGVLELASLDSAIKCDVETDSLARRDVLELGYVDQGMSDEAFRSIHGLESLGSSDAYDLTSLEWLDEPKSNDGFGMITAPEAGQRRVKVVNGYFEIKSDR